MKKSFISLVMAFSISYMFGQNALSFCASVDANGYCIFNNTKFIASPDSARQKIFMEVHNPTVPIGSNNLVFKIYSVNQKGEEKFEDMEAQKIQANWFMAWTPFPFKAPGKYTVKVYNDTDQMICGNTFDLMSFK